MHQSDEQFINIVNCFWIATQSPIIVHTLINQWFHTPPNDAKFSYLFYTNEVTLKHNELIFFWIDRDVYTIQNETSWYMSSIISIAKGCKLHMWLAFINLGKKTILIELCIGNYVMQDCLVKGANWIFQGLITLLNSNWILFNSLKCGQFTTSNNAHVYTNEIHCTWTPIKPIPKYIQIGSTFFHII